MSLKDKAKDKGYMHGTPHYEVKDVDVAVAELKKRLCADCEVAYERCKGYCDKMTAIDEELK